MNRPTAMCILVACAVVAASAQPAQADGIDIIPYLTRSRAQSVLGIAFTVLALMTVNYLLNLLVIGRPAVRMGQVHAEKVVRDLVGLTLLGQAADRVGALLAVPLGVAMQSVFGLAGEGAWLPPLLISNFLASGIAIAVLALFYVRLRWRMRPGPSWAIAVAAAVFTNPSWAMALWFFP